MLLSILLLWCTVVEPRDDSEAKIDIILFAVRFVASLALWLATIAFIRGFITSFVTCAQFYPRGIVATHEARSKWSLCPLPPLTTAIISYILKPVRCWVLPRVQLLSLELDLDALICSGRYGSHDVVGIECSPISSINNGCEQQSRGSFNSPRLLTVVLIMLQHHTLHHTCIV